MVSTLSASLAQSRASHRLLFWLPGFCTSHTTKISSWTYPRGLAASALYPINEETRPAHPSLSLSGQWCFLGNGPRACRSGCPAQWGARTPCHPCTWPGLAGYQTSSHWRLEEKERTRLAAGQRKLITEPPTTSPARKSQLSKLWH